MLKGLLVFIPIFAVSYSISGILLVYFGAWAQVIFGLSIVAITGTLIIKRFKGVRR